MDHTQGAPAFGLRALKRRFGFSQATNHPPKPESAGEPDALQTLARAEWCLGMSESLGNRTSHGLLIKVVALPMDIV